MTKNMTRTPTAATSSGRQRKTRAQRAQEAFDVAVGDVERLEKRLTRLRAELAEVEAEHGDAVRRRDFLAQHPDLPQQPAKEAASDV